MSTSTSSDTPQHTDDCTLLPSAGADPSFPAPAFFYSRGSGFTRLSTAAGDAQRSTTAARLRSIDGPQRRLAHSGFSFVVEPCTSQASRRQLSKTQVTSALEKGVESAWSVHGTRSLRSPKNRHQKTRTPPIHPVLASGFSRSGVPSLGPWPQPRYDSPPEAQ
jgi:hypothetical protein